MLKLNIKQPGFTLIEVLVALLVLSIGLLGLAGLQVSALRNTQSALFRSQAAMMAQDMAERMRENIIGVDANNYRNVVLPVPGPIPDCSASTCNPGQIATADTADWGALISTELPLGTGSVVCIDSAVDGDVCTDGSIHSITVRWDGDRSGTITVADPTVLVNVRP